MHVQNKKIYKKESKKTYMLTSEQTEIVRTAVEKDKEYNKQEDSKR